LKDNKEWRGSGWREGELRQRFQKAMQSELLIEMSILRLDEPIVLMANRRLILFDYCIDIMNTMNDYRSFSSLFRLYSCDIALHE
jgi:hypothetical protein